MEDREKYATVEEVFDRSTVMAAYKLIRKKIIDRFNGTIATGKESRVYLAFDEQENLLAVKIYLTTSAEFKRGMRIYLDDEMLKVYSRNFRLAVFEWCKREFTHLGIAYKAGVKVPKPIAYLNNVLVMEFLGEEGKPAPLIYTLKDIDFESVYLEVINAIEKLYRAGIVHADLSEFNIVYHKGSPYVLDFGQSVKATHANALNFLLRDIKNVNKFFRSRGVKVEEDYEIFQRIINL